ncbi:MAG: hypothetical protein R3344_02970 [Acidobacteriota bacterium]|nr:hypothetical protein [Acidobacteriota bacterium]
MRSRLASLIVMLVVVSPTLAGDHDDRVQVSGDSDERAIEIAQSVMEAMGGWETWDRTRFLSWKFFGRRQHYWDRWTGDVRISGVMGDGSEMLWLMNVNSEEGRVWKNGSEVTDPAELASMLETGRKIWVNDSYWLIMPYKLLDPGVTLKYSGERALEDGRVADVLDLTFTDVGYTPDNRYEVFVAKDSGLVEQWSFYEKAAAEEPGFTGPWGKWERFGGVMLATDHGRGIDWEIAVHDDLPGSLFTDPDAASP